MPRVVRLYVRSAITGFAVAGVFVVLVLWLNIANLGHLVSTSDMAIVAVLAFWILNGIVFSGVQFAWAITAVAAREDGRSGGDHGPRQGVPVLVAAKDRKLAR